MLKRKLLQGLPEFPVSRVKVPLPGTISTLQVAADYTGLRVRSVLCYNSDHMNVSAQHLGQGEDTRGQDYKRFSSMSRCSTHNLCSEMT